MTGGVTTRTSQNAARALGVRRWSGRIARGESIGESVGPSSGASPSSPASSSASITARGSRPRRSSAAADSPARLTRCSVPPARGASPRGARIPRVPASARAASASSYPLSLSLYTPRITPFSHHTPNLAGGREFLLRRTVFRIFTRVLKWWSPRRESSRRHSCSSPQCPYHVPFGVWMMR